MKSLYINLLFLAIMCNVLLTEAGIFGNKTARRQKVKNFAGGAVKVGTGIGKKVITRALDLFDKLGNWDLSKLNLGNKTQVGIFTKLWMKVFKKSYKNPEEESRRTGILIDKIKQAKLHNEVNTKYQQGVNELSDLTYAEIKKERTGLIVEEESVTIVKSDEGGGEEDVIVKASADIPELEDLPKEWDWRLHGIMTTPRNQGKCGSCWSFAAATVLESHNMKRLIAEGKFDKSKPVTVSEQNLIDCSAENFGSIGCDGGMPQQAWKYVAANGGVSTVESYPYKGKKEECLYKPENKADVVIESQKRLKTGKDEDLATAIYNYGPVAIAVHVTKDMAAYKTGIFDDPKCSPKKVNHAVVAVGYHPDYFIIRNSWGPKWGEDGYIKISRSKVNNCGVSQQGYYPILPNAVDTSKIKDKFELPK